MRAGAARLGAGLLAAALLGASARAQVNDKVGCTSPSWASSRLPGFEIFDCAEKEWMSMDVPLKKGGSATLRGSRSVVSYRAKDAAHAASNAGAQGYYVQKGEEAGAELMSEPSDSFLASLRKKTPQGDVWYLYRHAGADEATSTFTLATVKIMPLPQEVKVRATAGAWDVSTPPCSNPPWLVKQPADFKIDGCRGRDFDRIEFELPSGPKIVAGHILETRFKLVDPKKSPTALAVWTNFVGALKAIGAKPATAEDRLDGIILTQKTTQGEFWYAYEQTGGDADSVSSFRLTSVQIGGPTPGNCTLEVYGLDFDSRMKLLPSSMPVLTQLLWMFRNDASFGAEIGGHTDDKGDRVKDKGESLPSRRPSGARADEIKTWLTVNGVAGSRLTTVGYGSTKPLVPNTSDENRALNRRIELKRTACKP
jgi:hypothetical protein